jgi:hypothetical protein
MINRISVLAAALACTLGAPAAAAAQQPIGPSIEASLGLSAGAGGSFTHRAGGALDGVLAMPLRHTSTGTLVLALTGSANGPVAVDDICVVAPNDGCLDDYPTFVSLGVAAGVQRRLGSSLSTRVLAGPAYYQAVDGPDTFGLLGRVDVAKPLLLRTALVASLRGSVLPRYEGQTLRFAAFGLGLRIQ